MQNRLHDLAIASLGAGLALGASALLSAAPAPAASIDMPPEMRVGMNIVPISPADAKPPSGQVRQVFGSWVLIMAGEDDYYWVNFDQVLQYKSERRG